MVMKLKVRKKLKMVKKMIQLSMLWDMKIIR